MRRLAVLLALLAAPSAGAGTAGPGTFAVAHGRVLAVAQDSTTVAWLESSPSGCRAEIRSLATGTTRTIRYAPGCPPVEWDLAS